MPNRCRFAPSPTGYLHVGSAQSALFNWLFARGSGGEFVLRIEDTDAERNRPELTDNILDMLRWLGIDWDGEIVHQSDNLDKHTAAVEQLEAAGAVYWCDCTRDEIDARNKARKDGRTGYDGYCRDRGLEKAPGRALRFRVPEGQTSWPDKVRGEVTFENVNVDDFVVARSTGAPLFVLANTVDDASMGITHVIRGEDHVNNTAKYLLLWRALDFGDVPTFAHLPLLVNEQRKKLSKRRDPVSVADFKAPRLPARGDAQLPRAARLGPGGRHRDPPDRGDRRAVPDRGRQPVARVLRREEAAAHQRRVHPRAVDGGLRRARRRVPARG